MDSTGRDGRAPVWGRRRRVIAFAAQKRFVRGRGPRDEVPDHASQRNRDMERLRARRDSGTHESHLRRTQRIGLAQGSRNGSRTFPLGELSAVGPKKVPEELGASSRKSRCSLRGTLRMFRPVRTSQIHRRAKKMRRAQRRASQVCPRPDNPHDSASLQVRTEVRQHAAPETHVSTLSFARGPFPSSSE